MDRPKQEKFSFVGGVALSLLAHIGCAAFALILLEASRNAPIPQAEVFSVTLEGGERVGGINQAPKEAGPKPKAIPNVEKVDDDPSEVDTKSSAVPDVKESAALVEKRAAEEKAKNDAEAKRLAEERKIDERKEKERLKAEEEKRLAKEEERKQAEEEKLQRAREKKTRDARLAAAIKNAAKRYDGESANAGGEGFGAAALGGKGMGGGKLESLEFIAYRNELERHIKAGWRWLPGSKRLVAQIQVYLNEDGTVAGVNIISTSGSSAFDESVKSTVLKSSPVPRPPAHLYTRFQEVRITFDSEG